MNICNLPPTLTDWPIPAPPATTKTPFVLAVEANVLVKFKIPVEGIFMPEGAEKGLFVAMLYSHCSTRKIISGDCVGWWY